jgi:hypothetical protein
LLFNIQLLRDAIVFFTASGAARGVSGHTGGAYDTVPEVCILLSLFEDTEKYVPIVFDEAGRYSRSRRSFLFLTAYRAKVTVSRPSTFSQLSRELSRPNISCTTARPIPSFPVTRSLGSPLASNSPRVVSGTCGESRFGSYVA